MNLMGKLRLLLLALLFLITDNLNSQYYDLTFYHFNSIPQSYQINPSFVPECKWYFGFPSFSNVFLDVGHTGFTSGAIMTRKNTGKTFISQEKLLKTLNSKNYIFTNFSQEWLSFGFRFNKLNYFHFSLSEKFLGRFTYPKEFIEYLLKGNGSEEFFDKSEGFSFSKFNLDVCHYREIAFTFNSSVDPKLTIGVRPKFIFGLMNVITKRKDIIQYTDTFNIKATADFNIRTSLPESFYNENEDFNFSKYFFNFNNFGTAIDLGVKYEYNERINLSASVVDIGFINFKTNSHQYKLKRGKATYEFSGLDIASVFSDSTTNFQSLLNDVGDSLREIFKVVDTLQPYNWGLLPKIYVGGTYKIDDKSYVGALLKTEFYSQSIHPGFSLSYHRKFGNIFNLACSYTMINDCYTNFGVGFSLQLGPWQLYCTTDNIIAPFVYNKLEWSESDEYGRVIKKESVTIPAYWKNMNIHIGMNFIFGYKKSKEISVPSM